MVNGLQEEEARVPGKVVGGCAVAARTPASLRPAGGRGWSLSGRGPCAWVACGHLPRPAGPPCG